MYTVYVEVIFKSLNAYFYIITYKSDPSKSPNIVLIPPGENKFVGELNGFGVVIEFGIDEST